MLPSFGQRTARIAGPLAALAAAFAAGPLHADVRGGVEAWERGDYAEAVREWEAPAASGDPDALFNLAQAYRLGRGVPVDLARAEALYARAAAAGHPRAADTYGLLLFEAGRREAAMPYLLAAAARGDARAQYLVGIAHFNGDFVERDWLRAYALMTLANAAALPQAAAALAQMDEAIPLAQRRQAVALAERMRAEAEAVRNAELTAFELGSGVPHAPEAAAMAVAEEREAEESPTAARPAPEGPWRVQLGAFSVPSNAEALWNRLRGRAELAGARRLVKTAGRLTVLQAAGFASRQAAAAACSSLKRSGHDCLVTDR